MRRAVIHPEPRRRAGLTLIELLLAVAVTVVIAMAIATVMTAVARGLAGASEGRSAMQRLHAAHIRVRAYTDVALCLLQSDPKHAEGDGFALWLADDRPGGHINLSEFRVFWFNHDDGTLSVERVVFPESWTPEQLETADVELSPAADFLNEIAQQRKLGYTTTTVLADGLTSTVLQHSAASEQAAVRFQLFLGAPIDAEPDQQVLMALALPNHTEPQ